MFPAGVVLLLAAALVGGTGGAAASPEGDFSDRARSAAHLLFAELTPDQPYGDTRRQTLRKITARAVTAEFVGARDPSGPATYGVKELWFTFEGDDRRYRFAPEGTLYFSDWSFDIFSPTGAFVLLLQDRYGPYHVVHVSHLKEYLLGNRRPDQIVGDRGTPASVHRDARWLSPTEFSYSTTCCGETSEHRHSVRFLGYRPKLTEDTWYDYRPDLLSRSPELPEFTLDTLPDLVSEFERLIAEARARPGSVEEGAAALGGNPKEYAPSDAELLVARFGDAFVKMLSEYDAEAVSAALAASGGAKRTLVYNRFTFRHVDVMGSGRYFYASDPIPTVIELGD